MKKFAWISALAISAMASLQGSLEPLCPLSDEDPHFMEYRLLMIESSVQRLEHLVDFVEPSDVRELMKMDIQNIKYNLGDLR